MAAQNNFTPTDGNVCSMRSYSFKLHSRFFPILDSYKPPENKLNILHHNSHSLLTKIDNYIALPHIQSYDIISINETWLDARTPDELVAIPNYKIFRKDRLSQTKQRGGGSLIFIKSSYNVIHLTELSNDLDLTGSESVWIKISFKNRSPLIIASIYLPPNVNKVHFTDHLLLTLAHQNVNTKDLVLIGDLNINLNNKSDIGTRKILTLADQMNLSQTVSGCSYVSPNTGHESLLDLCFVSNAIHVLHSKVLVSEISDHYPITTSLEIQPPRPPRVIKQYRNFTTALQKMPQEMNMDLLSCLKGMSDINLQTEVLEEWVVHQVDKYAPVQTCRIRPLRPLWLTPELKRLVSQKNRFFRKIHKLYDHQSPMWLQYAKFRNYVQSAIKLSKKKFYSERLSTDTHTFFNVANKLLGRKRKPVLDITLNHENKEVTDQVMVAQLFNDFFTNIPSPDPQFTTLRTTSYKNSTFQFQPVKESDIEFLLKGLKSSKRGGINRFPASIYKHLSLTIVPALTIVINNCFKQQQFPMLYKEALVTPVFKKGDAKTMSNYRPISSLPVLSKILEKVMQNQLLDFIETNDLFSTKQFGFRKNTSTEHMLLYLLDNILSHLDSKKPSYVVLLSLDIRKAFDSVNHELLVQKLTGKFRLSKEAGDLIKSYLNDRSQRIKIGEYLSPNKLICKGVPQGSVLGPLIFNNMVNDMLTSYKDVFSYADDTSILTTG